MEEVSIIGVDLAKRVCDKTHFTVTGVQRGHEGVENHLLRTRSGDLIGRILQPVFPFEFHDNRRCGEIGFPCPQNDERLAHLFQRRGARADGQDFGHFLERQTIRALKLWF